MAMISISVAMKRAGLSRTRIKQHISKGTLKAQKNNRGHWTIDEDHLQAWLDARDATDSPDDSLSPDAKLVETIVAAKDETIANLRGEVKFLRTQLEHAQRPMLVRLTDLFRRPVAEPTADAPNIGDMHVPQSQPQTAAPSDLK